MPRKAKPYPSEIDKFIYHIAHARLGFLIKKQLIIIFLVGLTNVLFGQLPDSLPRKGSYLFYGQPVIDDNSMLMEEAFNQEAGAIQFISNVIFNNGNLVYAYAQEIPLAHDKHQLSFTFSYYSFKKSVLPSENRFKTQGFGDILISYRPLLLGKHDWALVIPRITLIVPSGDARFGLGSGAWGAQFNLAITKRLSRKITTHYNAGYTWLSGAHFYQTVNNMPQLMTRKDLSGYILGGSAIWAVVPRLNFLVEYVSNFQDEFSDSGSVDRKSNSFIINPGVRCSFQINKMQVVPGVGFPLSFKANQYQNTGAFFYLSMELAY